jgi:PAS domain S-box-containing protein
LDNKAGTDLAFRKSEERFRLVVESAPSAMVMIGPSGSIEMVNAQTERMFGYQRGELLGQRIEMLIPDRFKAHHPTLRGAFFGNPESRPMGAGRDLYGLKKDGSEFPIEIGLNPIETEDGKMVLSAIVDLTERKRIDAALEDSLKRFRLVIESAPSAMVMIGPSGSIEMVNAQTERMFGYQREELLGQRIEMLIPDRFKAHHPTLRGAFFGNPESRPMGAGRDLYGLKKDGGEFPIEIGLNPIETEDGKMVLSAIVDLTERRDIEQQLRESQKMEAIGQLTGGIAHDFNNLLAVVQGNLELIGEKAGDDPEIGEMTADALSAVARGATLTHQLLAFSRRQPLAPQIVHLDSLVSNLTKLLRRTVEETIEIKTQIPPDLWPARIDPSQLQNALLNLAVNARDAMPNGGTLILEAANKILDETYTVHQVDLSPGPYVLLTVSDTGVGMPKEIVDRVIEPFFTTKPVGQGTGLGLSMVYGFLKQSGGHLNIYSEVGIGTTVSLYLPRAEVATAGPVTGTPGQMAPKGAQDEVILVLEDDDMVRRFAVRVLTGLGYRTIQAANGPEALELMESADRIDLLLTDVVLPRGLNGPVVAERARIGRPNLKVLFMSGYTQDAIANNGMLDQGVNLLTKPFLKADLATKIREILDETREG